MTSCAYDVCSAAQSRNDERKPWARRRCGDAANTKQLTERAVAHGPPSFAREQEVAAVANLTRFRQGVECGRAQRHAVDGREPVPLDREEGPPFAGHAGHRGARECDAGDVQWIVRAVSLRHASSKMAEGRRLTLRALSRAWGGQRGARTSMQFALVTALTGRSMTGLACRLRSFRHSRAVRFALR